MRTREQAHELVDQRLAEADEELGAALKVFAYVAVWQTLRVSDLDAVAQRWTAMRDPEFRDAIHSIIDSTYDALEAVET